MGDATGVVAWASGQNVRPVLLDPVEWIIFQCLDSGDDPVSLAHDVADVVGIELPVALARIKGAADKFVSAGLIGDGDVAALDRDFLLPVST